MKQTRENNDKIRMTGKVADLNNYIAAKMGADIEKELPSKEKLDNQLKQAPDKNLTIVSTSVVVESITDALIRYEEGIATAIASEESIVHPSSANVLQLISKDGTHAIAFSSAIKELGTKLPDFLPALLYSLKTKDWKNVISSFFQALVSVSAVKKLDHDVWYTYALCCDYVRYYENEMFSYDTIIRHNNAVAIDLCELYGNKVKKLDDETISNALKTLVNEGLLQPMGQLYKIIW